jgi:hypothetical protein
VLLALIALAGVCILVPSFKLDDRITQGVLWGVASGLTFALLALVNRKYVQEYSGITIALYQDAFAALALLPFAFAYPPSLGAREWLLLVILGVLFTAVAHALFIAGLHGIRARTASMIACLEPVYGAALAALLLREIPSVHTAAGGLVILGWRSTPRSPPAPRRQGARAIRRRTRRSPGAGHTVPRAKESPRCNAETRALLFHPAVEGGSLTTSLLWQSGNVTRFPRYKFLKDNGFRR